MFVQINEAYAAVRRRLEPRRRQPTEARYVRKSKVTGRRVYARPAGHRADVRRPSYSHPAYRARRFLAMNPVPHSAAPVGYRPRRRRPRSAAVAFRRETARARDTTRAVGTAVVLYVPRTVNATVRAWLRDQYHPRKSHRHPDAGHRRQHIYLPNIGWCWETDQFQKVTI